MKNSMVKKSCLMALLVMMMALCCSCSQATVDYWNFVMDTTKIENVSAKGEMHLSIEDAAIEAKMEEIGFDANILKDITISFDTQECVKDMLAVTKMELGFGKDITLPITLYIDQLHIYFNTAEVIAILEQFADTETVAAYKEFFGNAKWVDMLSLTEADMEMLSGITDDNYTKAILDEYDKFFKAFAKAYSGMDSFDIINKSGNVYTFNMDEKTLVEITKEFLIYTVNNGEEIIKVFAEYIKDSTLFSDEDKAVVIEAFDELAVSFAALTESEKAELIATFAAFDEVFASLGMEFDIDYKLSGDRKAYSEEMEMTISYPTYGTNGLETGKVTLTTKSAAKEEASVNVQIPTENVAMMNDLIENGRKNVQPIGVNATIYLDNGYMSYSKEYTVTMLDEIGNTTTACRVIDNFTYLPLRAIAEACGEEVGWDNAKKLPFVTVDGQTVYMQGFIDNKEGRTYIKVRDFEKLGYTANYTKDEYMGGIVNLIK